MTIVIAAAFGALGAASRYIVSSVVQHRTGHEIPYGTAVVNLLGALALGVVVAAGGGSDLALAAAGFLGGFTTYSTWMVESIGLGLAPRPTAKALVNVAVLPLLGILAVAAAFSMAG